MYARPMRPRKFLLVAKVLATAGLAVACKKEDVQRETGGNNYPANPKGSTYDNGQFPPPADDAGATAPGPPPSVDAGKKK